MSFRYAYYSKPEEEFGKNWTLIVEYLAASRFPTTMIRVHEAQKGLPPRILLDTDVAPFISDFMSLQNTLLSGVNIVSSTHKLTGKNHIKYICFYFVLQLKAEKFQKKNPAMINKLLSI